MLNVTKIVGRVLSSNMYCIYEERTSDCWIVDIGDFNELKKYIPNNANIRGLFITHGHFDHVGAVRELQKEGVLVYLNENDLRKVQTDECLCGFPSPVGSHRYLHAW